MSREFPASRSTKRSSMRALRYQNTCARVTSRGPERGAKGNGARARSLPGGAATGTRGSGARWLPRRKLADGLAVVRHALREVLRDREGELQAGLRLLRLQAREVALGDLEHLAVRRRHRGDEPDALAEQRELAEVLARPDHRELLLSVGRLVGELDGPALHDEQRLAHHVLDEERRARGDDLVECDRREDLETGLGELVEERRLLERLEGGHRGAPSR